GMPHDHIASIFARLLRKPRTWTRNRLRRSPRGLPRAASLASRAQHLENGRRRPRAPERAVARSTLIRKGFLRFYLRQTVTPFTALGRRGGGSCPNSLQTRTGGRRAFAPGGVSIAQANTHCGHAGRSGADRGCLLLGAERSQPQLRTHRD